MREEKLLTLEEAVRKMTSRPAARVGLQDRGILRPGMAADITVFDPAAIRDVSTFEDPNHYSVGVRYVFVNGRAVVANGAITGERPGPPAARPGVHARPVTPGSRQPAVAAGNGTCHRIFPACARSSSV